MTQQTTPSAMLMYNNKDNNSSQPTSRLETELAQRQGLKQKIQSKLQQN
jgi:hypothetical protein